MTRLFTLIAILLTHFALGQQVKQLNEKYILKTRQLQDGIRTLEIVALSNSSLYWEVRNKNANRIRPNVEDIDKSLASTIFTPTEGKYFLRNPEQKFWFTIDESGKFTDSAIFENDDFGEKEYWTIFFENGNISAADVKQNPDGNAIRKIEANDTLFITKFYNEKSGKLTEKRVIKKGGNWQNSISTEYDENGNPEYENDGINKTAKSFHENGKQKSFRNSITNESIDYDTLGKKKEHTYPTKENGWCTEYFKNEQITRKVCNTSNHSEKITSYYKNGKLDYYEIEDNIKGEIKKYDKNKKLINSEKAIYIQAAPK